MARKVCIITQSPYPTDVRVRKEAMALLSRGYMVSVIALRYPRDVKEEVVEGVKVYRINLERRRAGPSRYLLEYGAFFILSFLKLNLLDVKEKFDVVHVNNLPDFLVFSAIIQKIRGRKIVIDMHEIMPEFFMSKYEVGFSHPMVRLLLILEKISLRFADEVITVNEPIEHIFRSRSIPDKPITVVMNTVSPSSVKFNNKITHKGFNCVYHGTLTNTYGLSCAIEGFSKVSEKFPDIKFHIFGKGKELPKLRKLAEDLNLQGSIIFHGFMPYNKVMEALAEMDLGLLTLRKDIFLNLSFSNKLAEYIHLKIPVINSDLDSVKFYFSDEHIMFFEAGNSDDLASKIEFAYMNREKTLEMAKLAYEHFNDFNWDIMAERYLEVIERC